MKNDKGEELNYVTGEPEPSNKRPAAGSGKQMAIGATIGLLLVLSTGLYFKFWGPTDELTDEQVSSPIASNYRTQNTASSGSSRVTEPPDASSDATPTTPDSSPSPAQYADTAASAAENPAPDSNSGVAQSDADSAQASNDPSPAFKLATIENPDSVPDDDTVQKYQDQINSLEALSSKPVTDLGIANAALLAKQTLQEKGVEETALSILEAVNQSMPSGVKQPLPDVFAAYVALRIKGMDRDTAVQQLQGIYDSILHPGN